MPPRKRTARGQIISRGPKTYLLRVYLGTVDGKRKHLNETFKGLKKDAEARLTELLNERDTNTSVVPTRMTVGQWIERWFEVFAVEQSHRTLVGYRTSYDARIKEYEIASVPLQKLTRDQIQAWVNKLAAEGYAPASIQVPGPSCAPWPTKAKASTVAPATIASSATAALASTPGSGHESGWKRARLRAKAW